MFPLDFKLYFKQVTFLNCIFLDMHCMQAIIVYLLHRNILAQSQTYLLEEKNNYEYNFPYFYK